MCLSPVYLKNVNRDARFRGEHFVLLKDTESFELAVPCGHCSECLQMKQFDIIQRCQMMYNTWYMFFGTLTYMDSSLPVVKDSKGNRHFYADYNDFYLMIKRFRQYNVSDDREIKYMCVNEYGSKRHRPHFHFILFLEKRDTDSDYVPLNYEQKFYEWFKNNWKRNLGTKLNPKWIDLFKYSARGGYRNYDFHWCRSEKGSLDDVSFYVSKYVLKFDEWIDKRLQWLYNILENDEYKDIRKLLCPRIRYSKKFGFTSDSEEKITSFINRGIRDTSYPFPVYFNQSTGKSQPLGRYYRKKYLTMEQALKLAERPNFDEFVNRVEFDKNLDKQLKFDKNRRKLREKNLDL